VLLLTKGQPSLSPSGVTASTAGAAAGAAAAGAAAGAASMTASVRASASASTSAASSADAVAETATRAATDTLQVGVCTVRAMFVTNLQRAQERVEAERLDTERVRDVTTSVNVV
jgi:hypothetical protein